MKEIKKKNVLALREELNKAFAKIGKKHGLDIKLSNSIRYNATNGSSKVEFSIIGGTKESPIILDKNAQNFDLYKHRWEGFEKLELGDTFEMQGDLWKIVGAKPRSRNSILCENDSTAQIYKVHPDTILAYMGEMRTRC